MSICTGRLLEIQYLNVQLFGRIAYSFEGVFLPPEMNVFKKIIKKLSFHETLKMVLLLTSVSLHF